MKLPRSTPLESFPAIHPELRAELRSLWVETLEEYLALLTAVEGRAWIGDQSSLLQRSPELKPAGLRQLGAAGTRLLTRPAARGLGCALDAEVLSAYQRDRRVSSPRQRPADGFEGPFPPAVRLMDGMLPVRDQGRRGTCTAFASVALREHLAAGGTALSEQFLYWACKELDGYPGAGTYLRTAAAVLGEYGVCPASVWAYHPLPGATEGQGPPPAGAREAAKDYQLAGAGQVEPSLVNHYKKVLAGGGGQPAMPVVIATLVFDSWFHSPETFRTGKITMPLPGEPTEPGGHAWCVVGYVDDAEVPGGGYFIVRNSWGLDWAAESPEAPGHALMPYAYVERFAVEAFTGPGVGAGAEVQDAATKSAAKDEFRPYLRRLREQSVAEDQEICPAGTAVLAHPEQPEVFRRDSAAARARFKARDFTWTDDLRRRLWFRTPDTLPADVRAKLDGPLSACQAAFLAALHSNVQAAAGKASPKVFNSWLRRTADFPAKFQAAETLSPARLTTGLRAVLGRHAGVPEGLDWQETWPARLNEVRALALPVGGRRVVVVAVFLCPFKVSVQASPELMPLSAALVADVQRVVSEWAAGLTGAPIAHLYLSLGGLGPLPAEGVPAALLRSTVALSAYQSPDQFTHRLASHCLGTRDLRDLAACLRPETAAQRVSRIRTRADRDLIAYEVSSMKQVAADLELRQSQVFEAFLSLQREHPDKYHLERNRRTADYVLRAPAGRKPRITSLPNASARSIIAQVVATGVSFGLSWFLLDPLKEQFGKPQGWSLAFVILFACFVLLTVLVKWIEKLIMDWFSD